MKIKVKKVKVAQLSSMIKKMLLMGQSVYLNVNGEKVWSSVYVPTKDVVKSIEIPLDKIFEFDGNISETIKLSFFSGSRLLSCIGYFDPHHLSMDISAFKDEDDGEFYADKILLKDQKLSIEIQCQDISLGFTSMTNDQAKRAFGKETEMIKFEISKEDLSKISQLISLDSSELFTILVDSDGVHIKTDSFDIIVDDKIKNPSPIERQTFKGFLDRIDKESYDVSLCENKIIMDSKESSTRVALNLAITD